MESFLDKEFVAVLGGFPLIPDEEGYLTLSVPRFGNNPERVPLTAVADDYGHIVHGVFLDPAKCNRKLVQAVSDIKSFEGIAQAFAKVTGEQARVKFMESADVFPTMHGQMVLEDVKDMFRYLQHPKVQGRYFNAAETEAETARG